MTKTKKRIVISVISIIIICLVLVISKSYSLTKKHPNNVLKTNGSYISFTINGASTNINFPTKDSGYIANSVSCTNGTTATWDNDKWGLVNIVSNNKNKINCNVDFGYKTYNITYNLDGGSIEGNYPTSYTIDTNTFNLPTPTKENYLFLGWTGSNGETIQPSVSIAKGSIGDKEYTANWEGNFQEAALRMYSSSDTNVSYTFNSTTGEYTITQKGGSTGWGQGVISDDSSTDINWGQTYMLEFDIYLPSAETLRLDCNVMIADSSQSFPSGYSGNDAYGTNYYMIDGVSAASNSTVSAGSWHTIQLYLMNDNETINSEHIALRSYSGFGLNLTGKSDVTYKIKNLRSTVF